MHHLVEFEWAGTCSTGTDNLFIHGHGELLVGQAVGRCARVLILTPSDVEVDSPQNVFEALGGIVHVAELEALLIGEGFGQCFAQGIGVQGRLVAVLELGEDHLQSTKDAGVAHTGVTQQPTVTPPEDVQVPENLDGAVNEAIVFSGRIAETFGGGEGDTVVPVPRVEVGAGTVGRQQTVQFIARVTHLGHDHVSALLIHGRKDVKVIRQKETVSMVFGRRPGICLSSPSYGTFARKCNPKHSWAS